MKRSSSSLRLFVAVYPLPETATKLNSHVRNLALPENRAVPIDQIHLTLQFIGDVDTRQLDSTIESVQRSTAGLDAFVLTLTELITLPKRGQTRLIAAQCDEPAAMMQMQRRLAHRLARTPRRNAGNRFLPHMTLTRFRPPTKFSLDEEDAALELLPFPVQSISLMRSTLRPDGAVHEIVQEFALHA